MRSAMHPLAVVLFCAIDTEAMSIDEVRAWADRQILQSDAPTSVWLGRVSLSTTHSEAADALRDELRNRHILFDDARDLLIGLKCLRHRRGELAKQRLIDDVGDLIDASDSTLMDMDVEEWNAQVRTEAGIPAPVQATLDELADQAEAALTRLLTTTSAASEAFWRTDT